MTIIGKIELTEIIRLTNVLVNELISLKEYSRPERKGGYFVLREKETGAIIFIVPLGTIDQEKNRAYFLFAQEKGERLYANQKLGNISSWQSRNEADEKYGGAIVAGDFILSFSGLPELGDEAIMLELAYKLGWTDLHMVKVISQVSNNILFASLHAKCN